MYTKIHSDSTFFCSTVIRRCLLLFFVIVVVELLSVTLLFELLLSLALPLLLIVVGVVVGIAIVVVVGVMATNQAFILFKIRNYPEKQMRKTLRMIDDLSPASENENGNRGNDAETTFSR